MENKSKNNFSQLTMGVLSLTIIAIGMWLLILIYLIKFKYIGSTEYPIEKLGQTGDFFNIATSFSGVITVMFVAYGIILQKKELISVQEQIEYQTKKAEEDERVNRTIEILYKWDALGKEPSEINELRVNFLKRISILYSSNDAFNEKIDFSSIVKILKIEGIYDYFIKLKALKEKELLELNKKITHEINNIKNYKDERKPLDEERDRLKVLLKAKGIPLPFSGTPDPREPNLRGKDSDEIKYRDLAFAIEGFDKSISRSSKIITERQAIADTLNTELHEVNKLVLFFHDATK